jgi:hypothetical protein
MMDAAHAEYIELLDEHRKHFTWTDAEVAAALPELPDDDNDNVSSVHALRDLLQNIPLDATRETEHQEYWASRMSQYGWSHLLSTSGTKFLHNGIVSNAHGGHSTSKSPDITRFPPVAPFIPPSPSMRKSLLSAIGAATAVTELQLKLQSVSLEDMASRGQTANCGACLLATKLGDEGTYLCPLLGF